MRRIMVLTTAVAVLAAEPAVADRYEVSVATGYNSTALQSEFNRGTEARAEIRLGHQFYAGTLDSRGLASLSLGRVINDEVRAVQYPMLTIFGQVDGPPGLEVKFHNQWFDQTPPLSQVRKWATPRFETEAGLTLVRGNGPKVRVSQQINIHRSRVAGRSQGLQWVWEFRRDFPVSDGPVLDHGVQQQFDRRTMRHEQWVFLSRELGIGVVRLDLGATHKLVRRDNATQGKPTDIRSWHTYTRRSDTSTERVPVLMLRLEYQVWRWS